jgi:Cof subfamily protein (haloacid dehalogenase superfamily)
MAPDGIAMIAADLDGTLLAPDGTMSARTMAALRAVQQAGIALALATGRRQSFALQALSAAGLRTDTVLITSNGAVTRTLAGTLLDRTRLHADVAQALCRVLRPYRDAMLFTFDRTGPGAMVAERLDTLHKSIARWVELNAHEIATITPLEAAFAQDDPPVQGMVCGSLARMAGVVATLDAPDASTLRASISVHRTEYALRDLCIVDLLPADCSKGRALLRLAAERGIAPAQVLAIGDNMNDAEMLAASGHAVVMANAAPELRAMAARLGWSVAPGNAEDGAAQVLEAILAGDFSRQARPAFMVD